MTECCGNRWCARHAIYKSDRQVELCQNDEILRYSLDRSSEERRKGLVGQRAADTFAEYGITKEWYTTLKAAIGLPPICDCDARKDWLSKMHAIAIHYTRRNS